MFTSLWCSRLCVKTMSCISSVFCVCIVCVFVWCLFLLQVTRGLQPMGRGRLKVLRIQNWGVVRGGCQGSLVIVCGQRWEAERRGEWGVSRGWDNCWLYFEDIKTSAAASRGPKPTPLLLVMKMKFYDPSSSLTAGLLMSFQQGGGLGRWWRAWLECGWVSYCTRCTHAHSSQLPLCYGE